MSELKPYAFASLVQDRLRLTTEVAEKFRRQQEAEAKFAEALQLAVPKHLQTFVRDCGIIETLLQFGKYSDRYSYNIRGLQSYKSVAAAIEELQKAWKDNVVITMDGPGERERVSIRYYAAPHIY